MGSRVGVFVAVGVAGDLGGDVGVGAVDSGGSAVLAVHSEVVRGQDHPAPPAEVFHDQAALGTNDPAAPAVGSRDGL